MNLQTKVLVFALSMSTIAAYACSSEPHTKTQYEPETAAPGEGVVPGGPVVVLPPPVGASDKSDVVPPEGAPAPTKDVEDVLATLPKGATQLSVVCGRNVQNAVTRALCKNPSITGLADLQTQVGLNFDKKNGGDPKVHSPGQLVLARSEVRLGRESTRHRLRQRRRRRQQQGLHRHGLHARRSVRRARRLRQEGRQAHLLPREIRASVHQDRHLSSRRPRDARGSRRTGRAGRSTKTKTSRTRCSTAASATSREVRTRSSSSASRSSGSRGRTRSRRTRAAGRR